MEIKNPIKPKMNIPSAVILATLVNSPPVGFLEM